MNINIDNSHFIFTFIFAYIITLSITIGAKKGPKSNFGIHGPQCFPILDCPYDTCNRGGCSNGCWDHTCTKIGCDESNKNENQLCDLKSNNCKNGLKCIEQDDGCDNGIGRCVKTGKPTIKLFPNFHI